MLITQEIALQLREAFMRVFAYAPGILSELSPGTSKSLLAECGCPTVTDTIDDY